MSGTTVVNEIARYSLNMEKRGERIPDDKIRFALHELFVGLAREIERTDFDVLNPDEMMYFPVEFPMRLTLTSTEQIWDVHIVAKLENAKALED